ncbi:MAG: AAA family ATPase [Actinomycetota bacterium]|nr:AAA family ATPase [Actinomycetota bacterium]
MVAVSKRLVERDRELTILDATVDASGPMVIIEGPPGIGKSSLIRYAVARAKQQGALVLSATGTALERQVAFGLARQLLAPVLAGVGKKRQAVLLDGAARPARGLFTSTPAPAGGRTDPAGIIEGLYWLTESLAAGAQDEGTRRPLMITVDDAHWSDEGSLRFLARLSAHLPALSATTVIAFRSHEASAAPLLGDLIDHPAAQVLRPSHLTEAGTERVVHAAFPDAEAVFATACSQATGGNPFYLAALLDELAAEGVPATAETAAGIARMVPSAASRSILIRLARLAEPAVRLAQSLAVLGDRSPLDLTATLAGLDRHVGEDAADTLAAAHLVDADDPLRFTHPLIGAAIAADLPAFARARTHRAAAELLARSDAPEAVVAAHLLACRPQRDRWVVATLRRAADTATAAGEYQAASQFLARAILEPPDDADYAAVRVAAALAGAANAEPGSDRALAAALDVIDEPTRRAEVRLALSRQLILRGDFAGAATAAEQGLDHDTDQPAGQGLLAVLLIAASRDATRRADALARFEPLVIAARAGRLPADPTLCARLASRMATAGEAPHQVRQAAARALADHPLVDPAEHGSAFAFTAAGIYWIDDYAWCQQAANATLDAARRRGTAVGVMAASHWQAASCRRLGQLDEAVVAAERSLAVARNGWRALAGWTGAILAATHIDRGDLDASREALTDAARVHPASLDWAFVLAARGALALAEGDPAAALEDLHAAGAHLRELYRIDNPAVLPWRSLAATAALRLGRREEALLLADHELGLARRLALPRPLADALRVVAVVTGGAEALPFLEEAVVVARSSLAPLTYARALNALGMTLRRLGRPTEAREPLGKALDLADAAGAKPIRTQAEAELHIAGGRRRRTRPTPTLGASLTPAQHRVATLAIQGLSNSHIAQRLYINTKTVEWHWPHLSRARREPARPARRRPRRPPLTQTAAPPPFVYAIDNAARGAPCAFVVGLPRFELGTS